MVEIERKFLARFEPEEWDEPCEITQGYLYVGPEKTVRVRVAGDVAYLTVKGPTKNLSRLELETAIDINIAQRMLKLFCTDVIKKKRYCIEYGKHTIEVDIFEDDLDGLIIAEVELSSEAEEFVKPDWFLEEVSHDSRYFNCNLVYYKFVDGQLVPR